MIRPTTLGLLAAAALLWTGPLLAQPRKIITRGLQRDALVLVQGHGKDGLINVKLARKVQQALTRIRAGHQEVAKIHARGYELRSLFVVLTKDAQARLAKKIKIKTKTGIPALDRLNARFQAVSVQTVSGPSLLRVRFRQPMDIQVLMKRYKALPQVRETAANIFMGDGHDITLEMGAKQWRFKFKEGSGDCPSGCIRNTYYNFTYAPRSGVVKRVEKN